MADPGFLEKGGSDKYIHNWGSVRVGACPSRDSKVVFILHNAMVPTAQQLNS